MAMNEYRRRFEYLKDGDFPLELFRNEMIDIYGWAIPSREALQVIKSLEKPIVELGAGRGFWAYCLAEMGVNIVAFDKNPPVEGDAWYPVAKGDVDILRFFGEDDALLICWPPNAGENKEMAENALSKFNGDTIIYIGEPRYVEIEGEVRNGYTATPTFFDIVDNFFFKTKEVELPRWPGIMDSLFVFERAYVSEEQEEMRNE